MEENLANELKAGIAELLRQSGADSRSATALRDELAALILSDIRNVMTEKHSAIYERLKTFETTLQTTSSTLDNQKLLIETSRISSDLNTVYTKLSAQEMLLQNMYKLVDAFKNDKSSETIIKLNSEFGNFARGFEQITATLNRNFTEFLSQVEAYSPNEGFKKLQFDLDGISTNTNAIISALAIIDHKYQDLKALITVLTDRETTFFESLQASNKVFAQFDSFVENFKGLSDKGDIHNLSEKVSAVNALLENMKMTSMNLDAEQRARFTELSVGIEDKLGRILENEDLKAATHELKMVFSQISGLTGSVRNDIASTLSDFSSNLNETNSTLVASFSREFDLLKSNMSHLGDEVARLQGVSTNLFENRIGELSALLKEVSEKTGDENFTKLHAIIEAGLRNFDEGFELKLNGSVQVFNDGIKNLQSDLVGLTSQFENYKEFTKETGQANITAMKELIDQALVNIENLRVGNQLKQLAITVEQNAVQIKDSFETMNNNFSQIAENSNIEVLKQLNTSIPGIADKLEIFRSLIASENADNIQKLTDKITEFIEDAKNTSRESIDKFREDSNAHNEQFSKGIRDEISYILNEQKASIAKFTDTARENSETLFTDAKYEIVEQKTAINKLLEEIQKTEKTFADKFAEISVNVGNISSGVTSQIASSFDQIKGSIETVCERIQSDLSTKIANSNGLTAQNLAELKTTVESLDESSGERISEISTKIAAILASGENISQQLEKLKPELAAKIDTSFDYSKIEVLSLSLEGIKTQIEELVESEASGLELSKISNKNLVVKVEEIGSSIARLGEKLEGVIKSATTAKSSPETPIDAASLRDFISGFEFLQNNFIEEFTGEFKVQKDVLKEILAQQAQDLDYASVKRAVVDALEDKLPPPPPDVGYSFEDIESDFAKLRLSIEEEQKLHLPERLDEIRNIGLENMRLVKKSEKQISNLGEWLDDTSSLIELLTEKIEKVENLNMQEIKARLVKSETASAAPAAGLDEFISSVTKKYQIQEMKIENIDEKITTLIQRQGDIVDIKSFIDAFHESAIQTKSLIARVEGIENQITSIHSSLEKIINYIED